jgi:hypothetical protein
MSTVPSDRIGAPCYTCGHTNIVHRGPVTGHHGPCPLCEMLAEIGSLQRALAVIARGETPDV